MAFASDGRVGKGNRRHRHISTQEYRAGHDNIFGHASGKEPKTKAPKGAPKFSFMPSLDRDPVIK